MAIVLITGTSSGIGLATAITLARAGHEVIATMRNPATGAELRKIVESEKLPVTIRALNVDSDESVATAVDGARSRHGHIDVLVNNAGVPGGGPVEEVTVDDFRRVMETNFFGSLRCIKAVLPEMRERRSGCIINVTSIAGRVATASQSSYSASKFALEALSECLAQEMKPFNVQVAIVEPGVIATPIFGKAAPPPPSSPYVHRRRLVAFFRASLAKPTGPFVVAETIRGIVAGESTQLRYPSGPDAQQFLQWRNAKSDEELVALGGASDIEWAADIKRYFGLDVVI